MKYNIGDQVKIVKRSSLIEETSSLDKIETEIQKLHSNRGVTIKHIADGKYQFEEIGWYWREEEIEKRILKKKIYRDLFNREIKMGDDILHLWCNKDREGYARGGTGAVKYKHATVNKFNAKTVGIEWTNENGDISTSSIKNTRNRIIILTNDKELLNSYKYKTEIRSRDDLINKLHRDVSKEQNKLRLESKKLSHSAFLNSGLIKKMEEMQKIIDELIKGSERFSMLDL